MGSSVKGTCPCGLEVEVPIGGGMANFATTCYFPCLCETCHEIVAANLLAQPPRCPQCCGTALIPYDDPRVSLLPGKNLVAGCDLKQKLGREVALTDGDYLCPCCKNHSLKFRDTGLRWD